jgi:hypothetical protein
MFFKFFNKKKVVESPLIQEIDRYLLTRSSFSTRNSHQEWLYKFANAIGVNAPQEVLESDFDMFLEQIKDGNFRPSEKMVATSALNLFRVYLRRQNNPKRHVGRPAKVERNTEMLQLRFANPNHWTYDRLAQRYHLSKTSVFEIIKREEEKELTT